MALWVIRILFLCLCTIGGYAISQVRPEWLGNPVLFLVAGFGFGWLLIAIDEMLKGFSLRAFSATTFGLLLGTVVALLVDHSGLFGDVNDPSPHRQIVRIALFVGFGYIGMVLAMRSNKEDFSLIIPYVRFQSQTKPENLMVLDTSAIIDGRIADLIEGRFLEGTLVVPRFVLRELQFIADSSDSARRTRGRRGLEMLNRLQRCPHTEIKIHEADFPDEKETDTKLLRLTHALRAKLFTNDHNLAEIAELQGIPHFNVHKLALALKPAVLPGEILTVQLKREGKEKGQALAYLSDGTLIVVNQAAHLIGQQIQVEVQSTRQTGMGVIVFAEVRLVNAA